MDPQPDSLEASRTRTYYFSKLRFIILFPYKPIILIPFAAGLRRRSAAFPSVGLRVRMLSGAWISVS